MMSGDTESSEDRKSFPDVKFRWNSLTGYRLIIWVWMMNDMSLVDTPTSVSHDGIYVHAAIQICAVVFIGVPLVYSEICIAQYSSCNILTMWNFFPLFRIVGYGTFYLIILKTIYVMVLASWYLVYTFYSSFDPPPWFLCDDFNNTKCMVKRINVSIFQHCIEAQMLFNDDCGMKTASNWFFEREIGEHNTKTEPYFFFPWKQIIASTTISFFLFVLSIRKEKFMRLVIKLLSFYMCAVILILCCVALSMSGSWYSTSFAMGLSNVQSICCFRSMIRGALCLGPGTGMLIFLSQDAPFRSPATMTAICTSLSSLLVSIMLSLIIFGGMKTVSYFHGKEENVIEIGNSLYFKPFGSIAEILTYFDGVAVWTFLWFSAIYFCLFTNLWTLHFFLGDMLLKTDIAQRYKKLSCILLIFFISILSWPFFNSDLTAVLTDATEIIQLSNNLFFSLSLYWIYGFRKHNVDIIFMIGIKASYFWKLTWLINPIMILCCIIIKWMSLYIQEYDQSFHIKSIDTCVDTLLLYIIVSIYFAIIVFGMLFQFFYYLSHGRSIRKLLVPVPSWGPVDPDLFKSRKMFVPEIMTTEFLYRQVRIHGYCGKKKAVKKHVSKETSDEVMNRDSEWCAYLSN